MKKKILMNKSFYIEIKTIPKDVEGLKIPQAGENTWKIQISTLQDILVPKNH